VILGREKKEPAKVAAGRVVFCISHLRRSHFEFCIESATTKKMSNSVLVVLCFEGHVGDVETKGSLQLGVRVPNALAT
jgi:hypothetical protein